jgi:hypothetical protein
LFPLQCGIRIGMNWWLVVNSVKCLDSLNPNQAILISRIMEMLSGSETYGLKYYKVKA